jgi:hypothetical protein
MIIVIFITFTDQLFSTLYIFRNKLFEKPVKPVSGCDAWKYRQKQVIFDVS